MRRREDATQLISVLARASKLIDCFGPRDRCVSISELSRRSGIAKSTVHRLTGEMTDLGFFEKSEYGLQLGTRLFELGSLARRPRSIREVAQPVLIQLRNATKHTVQLAVLDGMEVVYMDIQPGFRGIPPIRSRIGGRMPAHATGVGKALLAFTDSDKEINGLLPSLTKYTVTSPTRMKDHLAKVRERGLAFDHQESSLGVCCVASPIFGSTGLPVAALSVSTHLASFDPVGLVTAVREAAAVLTRRLL